MLFLWFVYVLFKYFKLVWCYKGKFKIMWFGCSFVGVLYDLFDFVVFVYFYWFNYIFILELNEDFVFFWYVFFNFFNLEVESGCILGMLMCVFYGQEKIEKDDFGYCWKEFDFKFNMFKLLCWLGFLYEDW